MTQNDTIFYTKKKLRISQATSLVVTTCLEYFSSYNRKIVDYQTKVTFKWVLIIISVISIILECNINQVLIDRV